VPVTAPDPGHVLALLREHDLDAAIDAGLMRVDPGTAGLPKPDALQLQAAQDRLRAAWEARERHRRRTQRLAARAAEREARNDARNAATPASAPGEAPAVPGLPPAAAAALARARARAAGAS
jgi:hypothetical protein